jgi:hypothetical protein
MTGRLRSGATSSLSCLATLSTCVLHVHLGTPFTIIAHDPHIPTRQE